MRSKLSPYFNVLSVAFFNAAGGIAFGQENYLAGALLVAGGLLNLGLAAWNITRAEQTKAMQAELIKKQAEYIEGQYKAMELLQERVRLITPS